MLAMNIVAAIFIAFISISSAKSVDGETGIDGGGTIQLNFLGTVDGKSYFTDETLRTWRDANVFCTGTGMHLATITSEDQWNFLANSYNGENFFDIYWTSLRDSQEPRQFLWDTDPLQAGPDDTIGLVWDPTSSPIPGIYSTCVSFNSRSGSSTSALNIDRCETLRKSLCET